MKDVFKMTDHVTRSKEQNRAFFTPNFETAQPVIQVNVIRPSGTTRLIVHIMVNPTKCNLVIVSGTPIDIQGVHSRKVKVNSTTSTVLGSLLLLL